MKYSSTCGTSIHTVMTSIKNPYSLSFKIWPSDQTDTGNHYQRLCTLNMQMGLLCSCLHPVVPGGCVRVCMGYRAGFLALLTFGLTHLNQPISYLNLYSDACRRSSGSRPYCCHVSSPPHHCPPTAAGPSPQKGRKGGTGWKASSLAAEEHICNLFRSDRSILDLLARQMFYQSAIHTSCTI